MKKKLSSFGLALTILLSLIVALPFTVSAASSGMCGENLTWSVDDDGTLTISGTGTMYDFDNYENRPPWDDLTIQSLVINEGITHIGDYAFSHQQIFATDIIIPEGVESLGEASFAGLTKLKNVSLPDSLIVIGDFCFGEGESLENIHIPKNVSSLGENPFGIYLSSVSCDEENQNFSAQDGILFNKDKTEILCYPPEKAGVSYMISSNINTIGEWAFFYNRNLQEIIIPETVKEIQDCAFWCCENLTSIELPNSISIISSNLFSYCDNLYSVTIPKSVKSIEEMAFSGCYNLNKVIYTGSEEEWNKITISENFNKYLINAKKHFNAATEGINQSIKNKKLKALNLTVYENKKDSSSESDSYRLSSEAEIKNDTYTKTSNSKGYVQILNNGSDITVSKKGYISRTISAKRANKSKKIYLQRDSGGKPIINAVWIDNTDVYNEEYKIGRLDKNAVTLSAEVVWKKIKSKIYLLQEAKKVEFANDDTLTIVLSEKFDILKPIYIVAEDIDGTATKKKLQLKDTDDLRELLDGNEWSLSFGEKTKGTISDDVPILGDWDIGVDVLGCPVNITIDGNKIYATVGIDIAQYERKSKHSVKKDDTSIEDDTEININIGVFNTLKEDLKKFDDSKHKFLTGKWQDVQSKSAAKVGFDAEFSVLGYWEGYIDSKGKLHNLDSAVIINPSISYSKSKQFLWVPPLFWETSLKGEVECLIRMFISDDAKGFTPNGSVTGTVDLKAGIGLGANKVVGVVGGGQGSLELKWDMYIKQPDYFALSGSIGSYAKAFIGPLTLYENEWDYAEGIIWDHPSTKVNSLSLLSGMPYYDIENYKLTDRSYTENETYFTANDNGIMTLSLEPQNKTEKTIKTNVYTYSEPQIVEFSNGHKLLVWIDDDADRGAVDRTALYYSFYGGTDWSEPKQVDNDGTADFSPNLKIIGNKAYLAWCNLSTSHSDSIYDMDNLDSDEIKNIFASYEISVAEFDADSKTFAKINIVTENDDYIEMNPVLFGDDNHVEIAWIQNRSDDLFSQGYDYYVMTSEYSNGEWSYPKAYGKTLKAIDSLSAYRYGLSYFAYSVDTDGNQQDYSDKEIYLNHSKITENDHLDAQPVFANNKLYYYSNGQIIEYNLNYGYSNVIIEDIPTDRFDIISNGNNTALVYTKSHGMSNELYAMFYDKNIEQWGKPVKLTELDSQISSYSGIFSENGDMIFALNCIKTSKNDISEIVSEQTDLVLYQVTPSYDLSVDNITFDGDKLVDGNTLELRMKINNKGELPITEFAVQIINDKNEVLSTTYGKDTIYAGESIDFKAFYPLGDKFMPHDITVKVVPLEVEDFNPSDNCKDVELSYDCLNNENINYCLDDVGNTVIYADIVNRGYVKYDTVNVHLYKNSLAGTKIGTVTINESLDTLDSSRINFEVSPEEDTVYYLSVEKETGSSDFVFVPLENKTIGFKNVSYSNNVINVEIAVPQKLSEKNPTILIALYKNNKLDRIYQPKSYLDTKCSFEDINDNIDSYMVKVFCWNNLTNCMPLCIAESSNINY